MIFAYRTAAVLATLAVAVHGAWATKLPPDAVFAPDSFRYASIPRAVLPHPDSTAFMQEFVGQKKAYYGDVKLNTGDFASPVDAVGPAVASTDLTEWPRQNKGFMDKDLARQWKAVPIPGLPTRPTAATPI
jgi:hypothetical protein